MTDLQKYLNVCLYPNFNPFNKQEVLEKMDFYLDINHYDEVDGIIETVQKLEKPIFAFDTTSHDPSGSSYIFTVQQTEEMVNKIKEFLEKLPKRQSY